MRKFLLGLALILATTFSSAMAGTPTIAVFSDSFQRASTPTGSSTGPYGTPQSDWGPQNGLIDFWGGRGNIASNQLSVLSTSPGGAQSFSLFMADPAYTPGPNEGMVVTTAALPAVTGNYAVYAIVRGQPNGSDNYACVLSNTNINITKTYGSTTTGTNGTQALVGTATSYTWVTNHQYKIDCRVTGDGSTTSTITENLYDVTAGNTLVATTSGTDTQAELQSGGRTGIGMYNNTGSPQGIASYTEYSDTAVPFQTVYLGFGPADSLTYSLSSTLQNVPDVICRMLNATQTTYHYIPVNEGFSGATAALYANGNASGYMAKLISDYNAFSVKFAFTTLADNDAIGGTTAATWLSNMNANDTYIFANVPTLQNLMFDLPPYFNWQRYNYNTGTSNSGTLALVRSYNVQGLTSVPHVLIGDVTANQTFQQVDYFGLTDGGHPNDMGVPILAYVWLNQYLYNSKQITTYPNVSVSLHN